MFDSSSPEEAARWVEASRLIERTATKATRRAGAPEHMASDVASEAWLELLKDAHRFDAARGDWSSFVLTIVARCARRTLYTMQAPVSGSPWRAHRWSAGLHTDGDDVLTGHAAPLPSPESYAIGEQFLDALRDALSDQPDAELAMAVFVSGEKPGDVAKQFQVTRTRVLCAVSSCREVVVSMLGHFLPERLQMVEGADDE